MDGHGGDDEEVGKRGGRVDRDQQRCQFGRVFVVVVPLPASRSRSSWLGGRPTSTTWDSSITFVSIISAIIFLPLHSDNAPRSFAPALSLHISTTRPLAPALTSYPCPEPPFQFSPRWTIFTTPFDDPTTSRFVDSKKIFSPTITHSHPPKGGHNAKYYFFQGLKPSLKPPSGRGA